MSDTPTPEMLEPPRPSRFRRIMKALLVGLILFALLGGGTAAVLRMMGIHVGLYGSSRPELQWTNPEVRYSKLEADRAAKRSGGAAAAPAEAPAEPGPDLLALPSWPAYLGPNRDGVSLETGLLESWPEEGPPLLYRQPVGLGWAGFAIGLGRAFTIEQRRNEEAVVAYDFETGRELWVHSYPALFSERMGGDGPRATPTLEGGRLYSLGAEGHLLCLNAMTGAVIWGDNILRNSADNLHWGMSGSPLVMDGRVYVTASGLKDRGVLAFDALLGNRVLAALEEKQSYASLYPAELAGRRVLVNFAGDWLFGLDPATGEPLWRHPWEMSNDINAGQPVVCGPDRVFISSGYGKGCAMLRVEAGPGGRFSVKELWRNRSMKNKFTTSILRDGHLYGLDEEVLACLDAESGKRKWKGGRYGHGQILWAEGRLIVMGEYGELALVRADPGGFQEISKFEALPGKTWNVPSLAGGRLLVRNGEEMACFDLRRR